MQLLWHARALDVVPASGVTSLIVASVPPAAPVAAGVVVVTVGVAAAELGVDVALTVVAVVHAQGAMRPRRQRRTLFFAAPRAPGHWLRTWLLNRLEQPASCPALMPRHVSRQLRMNAHLPCTESAGLQRFVQVLNVIPTCSLQASRPATRSFHTSQRADPTASLQQAQLVEVCACTNPGRDSRIARTMTTTAADFRTPVAGYTASSRRSNFRGLRHMRRTERNPDAGRQAVPRRRCASRSSYIPPSKPATSTGAFHASPRSSR